MTSQRIALISDTHGNAIALRAVLDHAQRAGVGRILCLGDVVTLGPTEATVLDAALGSSDATLFAGGHTHVQMLRQHHGRWVLNAGSVGMPFEAVVSSGPPTVLPFAEYCLLEVEGEHTRTRLARVALDRNELIDAARAWGQQLGDDLVRMYARYRLPVFC